MRGSLFSGRAISLMFFLRRANYMKLFHEGLFSRSYFFSGTYFCNLFRQMWTSEKFKTKGQIAS